MRNQCVCADWTLCLLDSECWLGFVQSLVQAAGGWGSQHACSLVESGGHSERSTNRELDVAWVVGNAFAPGCTRSVGRHCRPPLLDRWRAHMAVIPRKPVLGLADIPPQDRSVGNSWFVWCEPPP